MSDTAVLALRNVSLDYGRARSRVRALADVSLDFTAGKLHLVAGHSGSGKTSLLALLGCLLRPSHGRVLLEGQEVQHLPEERRADLRRQSIGYVFQAFRLLRALTAFENVRLALDIRGRFGAEADGAAWRALQRVGLEGRAHAKPDELSGGEKQRVAVARALVHDPKVVLADEPTASLDTASGLAVARLLRSCSERDGRVVVVVSHDPRLLPFADRSVTLQDGRVLDDRHTPGAATDV